MAYIVYISNGMTSTLNSSFEMGRQLADAGHQVSWLCDEKTSQRVSQRGFDVRTISSDVEIARQATDINARFSRRNPGQLLQWLRLRRKLRVKSIANDEIEKKVRELNPDLLLIDYEMHFAIIATAQLGIPTLLPIVWFSIFRRPHLPPLHTGLQPPATAGQHLANRLAWSRLLGRRIFENLIDRWSHRAIRNALRPVGFATNRRADLLGIARKNGYALRRESSLAHWIKPHAYRNLPVLCYNVQEMEFPHEPHPNMNYVGPMIDRDRPDRLIDPASISLWKQFLKTRSAGEHKPPLVYCSLGTFWATDQRLLNFAIDAFRRRPDWHLVIGLGGKASRHEFTDVPDNVLILDYAPQLDVIAEADAAITHGGITSINECVAFGVPMLVYSTNHVDQDGCAARVQYHRLGIAADRERASASEIEANVATILSEPAIKSNVLNMQKIFEQYRERGAAVRVIEKSLPSRL